MSKIASLTLLETLAIGCAVKDAALTEAKRSLSPGTYQVDTTVRIKGTITRGENTTGIIAQRAEPWALLAAALNKLNGVTVESLVAEAEAIRSDEAKMTALKERTAKALNAIKGEVKGPISGQTRSNLVVNVVGEAAHPIVAA